MLLNDASHIWGGDLSAAANGDLLLASGDDLTKQRIVRRLMTNPKTPQAGGDYLFEQTYGAGIPRFVGSIGQESEIAAISKGQVQLEGGVAQNPAPVVTARSDTNGVTETIQYTDNDSGQPAILNFTASL